MDVNTRKVVCCYNYKDIDCLYEVTDYPGGFVVKSKGFGRLHMFAAEARAEIMQRICQVRTLLSKFLKQFSFSDGRFW